MTERVGQRLGNYQLLRLIGRGGFAEVYLGEHIHLKSPAALKILHAQFTEENAAQFMREAQTLARLIHPRIVRVLDFALEDGTPFLIMEYTPHGTLRQRHPRRTCLPLNTINSYVQQVALALQYAHNQRLIHRDVKPENMLLNSRDEVLLSDFGLVMRAPHTASFGTQEEQPLAGTTHYMAPEQLRREPRPESDQYALAVVVYEWLCGQPPFQGSFIEVATQHVSMPPPSLRNQVPELAPAVEEVVLKALAKDPKERYPSVQDFAFALAQAGSGAVFLPASPPVLASDASASLSGMTVPISQGQSPAETLAAPIRIPENAIDSVSGSEKTGGSTDIPRPAPVWKVPTTFTPLIGREQDVTTISTLLHRPNTRLLTLLGTGGIGKTRLSLQIAMDMRGRFVDGVCFVGLATVSDADLVIPTIAQEFGIQEGGAQPILELVKIALRERQLLLILDNFEQVVSAAPYMEELLAACPLLKILVTSREALRIQAEQEFPVSPLSLPNFGKASESGLFSQSAAVNFFVQRAQAVQPTFQITSMNARTIAEICVRLDGLPLAIELAAARLKLLPPQALLARLEHRLQVLSSGGRDLPARHRALRNTIAWSYDLLDEAEQQLFRRLAIFVGGCTLEVVENFYAAIGDEVEWVLEGVASLIDKSLLQQVEQGGIEPRFVMLETIREYGLECLAASGEMEVACRSHATYYLSLLEKAWQNTLGVQYWQAYTHLGQEHDNLRAALRWSVEQGGVTGAESVLRLSQALLHFWTMRGYVGEGRRWLERALDHSEQGVTFPRARGLAAAGILATAQDDFDAATVFLQESVELYRKLSDSSGIAFALQKLGLVTLAQGNYALAQSQAEEALAHLREAGGKWSQSGTPLVADSSGPSDKWAMFFTGLVLDNLVRIAIAQGEYARAHSHAEEYLALAKQNDDRRNMAISLFHVALLAFMQGEPTVAYSRGEESVRVSREINFRWSLTFSLGLLGLMALQQGYEDTAYVLLEESLTMRREVGDRWGIRWGLYCLGWLAFKRWDGAEARVRYEKLIRVLRRLDDTEFLATCLEGLGSVVAARDLMERPFGDATRQAVRIWGAAEALREASGVPLFPHQSPLYEHAITAARARLGEEAFAMAWAEGKAPAPSQTIAELERIVPRS